MRYKYLTAEELRYVYEHYPEFYKYHVARLEEAGYMNAKKKKDESPPEQAEDKGPSLNDIVIEALNQTGGTARLKDVEKFARERYESMGKAIASRFNGMVWHSLQRVAVRTEEAGHYRILSPEEAQEAVEAAQKAA